MLLKMKNVRRKTVLKLFTVACTGLRTGGPEFLRESVTQLIQPCCIIIKH